MLIKNANLKFRSNLTPLNLNNLSYLVIHHLMAKSATPNDIHNWHLQRGTNWLGAGYNYYIRKNGDVFSLRGLNVGAHTSGNNSNSIGIALEGDYDVESIVPDIQVKSLQSLVSYIQKDILKRNVKIVGHRDLVNSKCPGKYIILSDILNRQTNVVNSSNANTSSISILKRGSSGSQVKGLQIALNLRGYKLVEDGLFGPATENAVRDFQSKNNLVVDGIVGPKTISKLNDVSTLPKEPHWAEEYYNNLISKGVNIHDKRFDDNMTRGEVMAILSRVVDTLK